MADKPSQLCLSVCLSVLPSCVCVSTSAFSRVSVCLSVCLCWRCVYLCLFSVYLSASVGWVSVCLFSVCLSAFVRGVSVYIYPSCVCLSTSVCPIVCLSVHLCPSCVCLTAAVYIHIFDVNSAAITMKNDANQPSNRLTDQSAKLTQTSKLPCTQNKQAINQSTNWPVANLRPASKLSSKQSNH